MSNYILIGASGGIGSQLTEYLQRKGHSILLAQHKSPINKEALVQTLTHISSVEATDFESVHNLFSYGIKKLGNIDGIINLAGSILLKPAHKTTNKEFDHTINQNLKSSFSVVRAAGLLLNNASVVLMSSAAASIGFKNHEAIAAAKAGIEGLARSAAATYSNANLRFNVIAPSLIDTPLTTGITSSPLALKASEKMHPLGRIGTPFDLIKMIDLLLDKENNWITGNVFHIDGGITKVK
ncbi:MAG: SDR family oxidoreductase [Candidatus Neomarinimicrobiota bacterium]|nr:SDR family oxidoreductase [Candidatus Neomarinimicrobiota bacterium]